MSFFIPFQMVLTRSQSPITEETKLASPSNTRKLSAVLSSRKKVLKFKSNVKDQSFGETKTAFKPSSEVLFSAMITII